MELKNRSMQPEVVFSDSLVATVSCHNSRNMPLVSADLANVSYDRILQMAKERTANAAAYTFTLIGNYDEATIRPLIEQYIASLPAEKKVVKSQDVSTDFKGVVINNFKNKAETPKAIAVMVWHTKQIPYTLENDIKASIAGQVLQMVYLKKIREDASAAYTVVAQGNADRNDFTNEVQLLAYCPMKPEKGDIAVEILRSEVEALANTCDADMLTKVKEYMLKNVDDQAKTNGYWAGVISDWRKWGLDMHTDFKAVVQAQTPESISAFVKEMLKAGNRAEIVMMPAE
jgi:zinc protease